MNVAELIDLLKAQPPDMRVVISGYEGGVCDLEAIKQIPIKLNQNDAWYYGPHEEVCHDDPDGDKPDEVALSL